MSLDSSIRIHGGNFNQNKHLTSYYGLIPKVTSPQKDFFRNLFEVP